MQREVHPEVRRNGAQTDAQYGASISVMGEIGVSHGDPRRHGAARCTEGLLQIEGQPACGLEIVPGLVDGLPALVVDALL